MTEPVLENVQLVGRHVPDQSIERDERNQPYSVPLPGNYEVGIVLGGTFVSIYSIKAGNYLNPDGSAVKPPALAPASTNSEPADSE
jgi:hypothetical protein